MCVFLCVKEGGKERGLGCKVSGRDRNRHNNRSVFIKHSAVWMETEVIVRKVGQDFYSGVELGRDRSIV